MGGRRALSAEERAWVEAEYGRRCRDLYPNERFIVVVDDETDEDGNAVVQLVFTTETVLPDDWTPS